MRMYLFLIWGMLNGLVVTGQTDCKLDSLSVTFGNCANGQVDVTISFAPSDTRSEKFTVSSNDTVYGNFLYTDLPLKLKGLSIDLNRDYVFKITDSQVDTCWDIFEYGAYKCLESTCSIIDLQVSTDDSCSYDGYYSVDVDFTPKGFTSFDLYANWEYFGTYGIDELPLHIPDFPSRNKEWDLIKIYAKNANDVHECHEVKEFLAPICKESECGISDLEVKVVECNDSSFFVKMDLEHYGAHSTTFIVSSIFDDGKAYPYSALPIILGPYPSGLTDEILFTVSDLDDSLCVIERKAEGVPCHRDCAIGDLHYVVSRCDSGTFDLSLSFKHKGSVSDSFAIRGNGNVYGHYSYEDVPIQLKDLPAGTGLEYEFLVVDLKKKECHAVIDMGPIDCRCYFPFLFVGGGDCTSDSTYAVQLRFDLDPAETFSVNSQGTDLGTYTGADLPLRIADFPASGEDKDVIHICFGSEDSSCCIEYEVKAPACARRACIYDVSAVPGPCLDNGGFYVEIDFSNSSAEAEDTFYVKKYGHIYGAFRYGDLPAKVGPFPSHQNIDSYVLDILDGQLECHSRVQVDVPQCGCNLGAMHTNVFCATDSTYELILNLKVEQDFYVLVNGIKKGSYTPNDLPISLELLRTTDAQYDYLQVCAGDGICCVDLKIEVPDCRTNPHSFSNITYEISECDPNNGFYVVVDFDTLGACSDSFLVAGGGQKMKFSYGELPVKVGPFLGGDEFYHFDLFDAEVDRCRGSIAIGRVVCPEQCNFAVRMYFEECVGEDYFILVVDSRTTDFSGMDLYYDSISLGFYKTANAPHRIKVPIMDLDSVSILACVSDNTSCCFTVMIPVPQCEEQKCELSELQIDTMECRNDSFWVNLSFNHGGSDSLFKLLVNESEYQVFGQEDIPLHVGPFFASENSAYKFAVELLGHPDCAAVFELETASCPGSGIARGVKVLVLRTDERNIFVEVPDFISEKTDLHLYDLQGRLIHNSIFSSNDYRPVISTPEVMSGMYIVRLRSKEGIEFSRKIIVP